MTCYQIKFWTDRGFSVDDAKYQISIRRPYNKNYWVHKYGVGIGDEKYYEFITNGSLGKKHGNTRRIKNHRCVEYWVERGYSTEDAKKIISDKQSTFSLDSCIKKYGEDVGRKIFLDRQKKWQCTIKNKHATELTAINEKKTRSLQKIIEQHGDDWIRYYIDEKLKHNNEVSRIAKLCLEKFDTKDDLIHNFKNISDLYKNAYRVLRLVSVKYKFGIDDTNVADIYNKIIQTYGVSDHSPTQYGCKIKYNGVEYKSIGEFEIAKFLTESNYTFSYGKLYPNQKKYHYDFYIQNLDLYVEYTGMVGVSYYDIRLVNKKTMCLTHKFNVIFSNDVNEIKNRITCYGDKKNND